MDRRARIRFLASMAAGCGLIVAAAYGAVMTEAKITSLAEARDWVARSRYGIEPNRGYLRMVAGIPRSFFYLGQDTAVWKRLLFRGAGNRASAGEIAASGLWKVAAVYLVSVSYTHLDVYKRQTTCCCVPRLPIIFCPVPPV